MSGNRTNYVIIASTVALLALIIFQVKWMNHSRALIEEQFNEKVHMALCFAVENLHAGVFKCNTQTNSCVPFDTADDHYELEAEGEFAAESLDSALAMSLDFYAIKMDYEVRIDEKKKWENGIMPVHSCSLMPLEKNDTHLLSVFFPGKEQYIVDKMKFLVFSSVLIVLFITMVFGFANYTLLKQRRMSAISKAFFNNMAHEFRTPLTNITLAGSLLNRRKPDETEKKYIQVIKKESGKLIYQVERVLHLAKLENGEYQLEKEKIIPAKLLQQVIEDMELQIREKNAHVNLNIEEENLELIGDKFHLGNAFRNLLDNALKYSEKDPEINVTLQSKDQGIIILFEDNGIGIPKKDQACVFDEYQRVPTGDVHNQQGFGLGLSYVKMIIEKHKGAIKVFSDLNRGTRFDLYLPTR